MFSKANVIVGVLCFLCRTLPCFSKTLYPWQPERIAILTVNSFHDSLLNSTQQIFSTLGIRNVAAYASKHGYTHVVKVIPPHFADDKSAHINWNRVLWTRQRFGSKIKGSDRDTYNVDLQATCYDYDWVVWMDSDVFITNQTVKIEEIIEKAKRYSKNKSVYPDMIATLREGLKKGKMLSTGVAVVRCSDVMLRFLNKLLDVRVAEAENELLKMWDHQGAAILARRSEKWIDDAITIVPQRMIDAHPYKIWEADGNLRECDSAEEDDCDKGYWRPGDFLIHFPGAGKLYVEPFLKQYPPDSWIYGDPFPAPVPDMVRG